MVPTYCICYVVGVDEEKQWSQDWPLGNAICDCWFLRCCIVGYGGQPKFDPVAAHLGDDRPLLAAFVTERSWLLFHLLESRAEWLGDDLDTWHDNDDYIRCQLLCLDMEVVNDAVEEGCKGCDRHCATDTWSSSQGHHYRCSIWPSRSSCKFEEKQPE